MINRTPTNNAEALGRPLSRSHFNDKWRATVELAGLPEGTRFHDLKHVYTSRLGADGQYDPKTVQALSRHAEFSETWDTYAHPPVAVQGVKVDTFTGLFGAGGPGAPQARYGTRRRVDGSGTTSSTARPHDVDAGRDTDRTAGARLFDATRQTIVARG